MAEKQPGNSATVVIEDSKQPREKTGEEPRITVWLVIAIITTFLGSGLPSGYCIGVLNTPQEIIRAWVKRTVSSSHILTLNEEMYVWAVIVSTFVVGAIMGAPFGGLLADRVGRRMGLFINHLLFVAAAGFIVSCKVAGTIILLLIGRFISGICAGLSCSLMPVYLSEVAPAAFRGVMGVLFPSAMCLGLLLSQILGLEVLLGSEDSWPYLVGGFGVPVLVALLMQPALPDSPSYCFMVLGNEDRGRKALHQVRGGPSKAVESEEQALRSLMINNQHKGSNQQWGIVSMIRSEKYRLSLLIVIICNFGQQFSGINAVFYYSTLIFRSAGLSVAQSQGASIGAAAINWLTSLIAIPLIRYGRRRVLLLSSIVLCIGCHAILMTSLTFTPTTNIASYVSIASLLSYVLSYNLGIGPVPYMIATELFPVGPRSVGISVASTSNWASNLIVGLTFPLLQRAMGVFSFICFIVALCFLGIFTYRTLPETLGKEDLPQSQCPSSAQDSNLNTPTKV